MPLSSNLFTRYEQEMRLRNYAHSTIKTYKLCLRQYVTWLTPTVPRDATPAQVHDFFHQLLENKRSTAWIAQCVSALKFLYVDLYRRNPNDYRFRHPRRQQRLPYVPNRVEVRKLAAGTNNRKHRLAILLLYAAGLRASELIAMNIGDVDLNRCTLHVYEGKGGKDRVTIFSKDLLTEIQWIMDKRPRAAPLIPARDGSRWTTRSLQKVIRRSADRAGLPKRLTPHSLRHAFATHLLEDGTELRLIQGLLGHSSIQTTTRYARIQDPRALQLKSPL